MTISFEVLRGSSEDDAKTIEQTNLSLKKMRSGRLHQIDPANKYIKSKLAWKLATLREPLLYRVVALAESFAVNWNCQNLVGAYLPARALIETSALLLELEADLRKYIGAQDLASIDALLMNRLFSTRDAEWLAEHPEAKAINVLTLIDRLDERELKGIREHYDHMSEVCHPNSLGHRLVYGEFDARTGLTLYQAGGWAPKYLGALFASMVLIIILNHTFEYLDARIKEVILLQSG